MMNDSQPTKAQVLAAITEGVRQAFDARMPDQDAFIEAIQKGVDIAFPWFDRDTLYAAIAEGTEEAIGKGQREDVLGAIALGTERAMES